MCCGQGPRALIFGPRTHISPYGFWLTLNSDITTAPPPFPAASRTRQWLILWADREGGGTVWLAEKKKEICLGVRVKREGVGDPHPPKWNLKSPLYLVICWAGVKNGTRSFHPSQQKSLPNFKAFWEGFAFRSLGGLWFMETKKLRQLSPFLVPPPNIILNLIH